MKTRDTLNWKLLLLAGLALLAAACGNGTYVTPGGGSGSWSDDATAHRSEIGERFSYICPPGGEAYSIWGTGEYTDDSSVCTAAVHAGKITFASGGNVVIEMVTGSSNYVGSTQNGVVSHDYSEWPAGFTFP